MMVNFKAFRAISLVLVLALWATMISACFDEESAQESSREEIKNVESLSAAKSANFSVSKNAMSFLLYAQYESFLNQYGSYASAFGLDPSKPLKAQWQDLTGGVTWYDYFAESAKNQVKELLICCEAARASGMVLTEENKADIDKYIEKLCAIANENSGKGSTEGNLETIYGKGVRESDIREALELSYLAQNWKDKWRDDAEAIIKDVDIEAFVAKNKATFYKADYMSYTFTAVLRANNSSRPTSEESAAYDAENAAMKELADKLFEAATDADSFKFFVKNYITEILSSEIFDQYYGEDTEFLKDDVLPSEEMLAADKTKVLEYVKALIDKVDADAKEDADNKDDDAPNAPTFDEKTEYGKVMKKVCYDLAKDMEAEYVAVTVVGRAYADPAASDTEGVDKWVFADGRKTGDKAVFKKEDTKTNAYTVTLVNKAAYINEDQTHDIAHILFTKDKYGTDEKAKAEAERVLALYKNGTKTLEAFEALGKEYTEDSGVKYENVKPGDMVEEFNDWMFDEPRKVGDVDIVKTTYGYHIMYYVGEGDIAWKADARDGLLDEKYFAWCDEQMTIYKIEFDDAVINTIEGR